MEAFLDLLSAGSLQVEPLLAHRFPVEEGGRRTPLWRPAPTPASSITMRLTDGRVAPKTVDCRRMFVQPRPKDKLRVGCIGAGRICARGHFSPSALLRRG